MACRDSSTLLLVECPSGVVLLFRCRPFVDWLFPNYKGILGWKYLVGSVRSVIWSYKRDVAEAVEGDTGVVDAGFGDSAYLGPVASGERSRGSRMLTRIRIAPRIVRLHRVHIQTGRPIVNELQDATMRTMRTMEEAEKIKKVLI
jgi:hypothetical protein